MLQKTWKNNLPRPKIYCVVEQFNPDKDYGVSFEKIFLKSLSQFDLGDEFGSKELATKLDAKFTTRLPKSNRHLAYETISLGIRIGIFNQIHTGPTEFDEFCKLETVRYFAEQLRGSKYKHKDTNATDNSTKSVYLRNLYKFDRWIRGRRFTFKRQVRVGMDTLKEITEEMTLGNVEIFLKLYQESHGSDAEFVKMIKSFLLDEQHKGNKPSTMNSYYCTIRAYFDRNDSPISFRFNPSVKYDDADGEKSEVTLEDLKKILTIAKPTVMEKAVVLAKFHRGLDNSTFADRFNYSVWEQMSEWFGTEEYKTWDVRKCPVPIKLTRIKTSYHHVGFLDIDAVNAIKDWLKVRRVITGSDMREGSPMFINTKKKAVTDKWISSLIRDLATKAGIQSTLSDYQSIVRYKKNSHELRDLLKSTLIDSGTRLDVADHVIGHKPKDSYEKQNHLYPESVRAEYMKASNRINMFSSVALAGGDPEKEILRRQLDDIKMEMVIKESNTAKELQEMRKNQEKIMEYIARQESAA